MRKSKIKQISLAVCLAFMPFAAYSAGLGKLNVNSGLGEPFRAELELLSVTPEELSSLVASIASEEAYATQGITRLGIHNNIKVEVAKSADGSPILKLRSSQPISDPYLDMLIQMDWATGRLQREYTVLLDPPEYKSTVENSAIIPVAPPSVSKQDKTYQSKVASTSSVNAAQPSVKKSRKLSRQVSEAAAQQNNVTERASEQDLTTKRGDTLISVAKDLQVDGVSLDQMLVGLYENNIDAFSRGNMNRLKVGQIIKVPSKESLTSIDTQQAKQSVKVHSTNWNAYRNALASTVAKAPVAVEAEQKQSGSGKIATAEDKAKSVKVGPQDVVKLSAGDKDVAKAGKDANKSFDSKIVALQEEAAAREKSLKEYQARADSLEKQIQDMQKLLALKSQSMAELQKNIEVDAKAADEKAVAEASKTEEVSKKEASTVVEVKPLEKAPEVLPEVKKEKPAPQAKTPVTIPPEPQAEQGFLDGLMNSVDLVMLGGASGVALLGAGWMFLRNKRRKDLDSFERGILTSGGLRANTVFGNTTGSASASDTSFLTDFSQNADGSMIDTNDVDPIAEAEVYMAYGRDAQAEEILKDAITKEPKRYELHLKLLEMYAGRKDASAFEVIAGELYTTLGANDPTWAKVAVMGAVLEPGNPLYDISNVVAIDALSTENLDVAEVSAVAATSDSGLDFSFEGELEPEPEPVVEDINAEVMQNFSEPTDVDSDTSFDLDMVDSDSLGNDIPVNDALDNISEEVSSIESTDTNNADENAIAYDAPKSNVDADNSMDFDLNDLSYDTPVDAATLNLDKDLPSIETAMESSLEFTEKPVDISAITESQTIESPGFDMDFMLTEDEANNSLEEQPSVAVNAVDDVSFDLDFTLDEPVNTSVAEPDNTDIELSFDLPLTEEPVVSDLSTTSQPNDFEANTFDLSSISLDLGETEVESYAEQTSPLASVEPESQDVNIKLDLVDAYIDMDDKEGARELLEEVMKEGGAQQKIRAQALLDSLV